MNAEPAAEFRYALLKESLRGGVQRWIEHGIQPGGFLSAVIANDLMESFGRADDQNRTQLFPIVSWFYNEAPRACWGSAERARAWAKRFDREFEWHK